MDYKDILKLGFVRQDYEDSIFEDRYGYKSFDLAFIRGNVNITWDPVPRKFTMYLNDRYYKPLTTDDMLEIVELFK